MRLSSTPVRRLLWAVAVAIAVVATAVSIPSVASREGSLVALYDASKAAQGLPHVDRPGMPAHNHNDPATKNAISRAGDSATAAQDPTTADERRANAAAVAAARQTPDPRLTTAPAAFHAPDDPRNRYAMANGCYAIGTGDRWVKRVGDQLAVTAGAPGKGEPFFLKPTDLGSYLLYGKQRDFVNGADGVSLAAEPSPDTEWIADRSGNGFTLRLDDNRFLAVRGDDLAVAATGTRFRLQGIGGCAAYPESQIDVTGAPHAGVTPYPGGARVRRRAHPRHGLRVPRRRRRTAASRGTSTARRTPSSTAPTTPLTGGYGGVARGRAVRRARTTTRSAGRRSRTGRHRSR